MLAEIFTMAVMGFVVYFVAIIGEKKKREDLNPCGLCGKPWKEGVGILQCENGHTPWRGYNHDND